MVRKSVFGIFTAKEYRKLLAVIHPDNFQDEERKKRATEVFHMVKEHEDELASLPPKIMTTSSGLPRTVEELLARKEAGIRERARKRAERKKAKQEAAKPRRSLA